MLGQPLGYLRLLIIEQRTSARCELFINLEGSTLPPLRSNTHPLAANHAHLPVFRARRSRLHRQHPPDRAQRPPRKCGRQGHSKGQIAPGSSTQRAARPPMLGSIGPPRESSSSLSALQEEARAPPP